MKKFNVMLALVFLSSVSFANSGAPLVVKAAEAVLEKVETLDTRLHAIAARPQTIQIVHHTEETVSELLEAARAGRGIEVKDAMRHLEQDMRLTHQNLVQDPAAALDLEAINAWNSLVFSFRQLQRLVLLRFGR